MQFFSDNAAPACPQVMEAIASANRQDRPYDSDRSSKELDGAFSTLFGIEVRVLWVSTGTAANALGLAALCPPHGAILCHQQAHIQEDECGAPEFYTHGAKLLTCPGEGAKLTPEAARKVLATVRDDVHQVRPSALSITNANEYGLVYTPDEIAALGELCRERGLGFHMDGARFANAVAYLDCDPADVTWRAGVDVLSFGFVKNGGMIGEALVFFRPELAAETAYRRKRGGHLLSKGRYLVAQILAMLKDGLWLANARSANAAAALLGTAAGSRCLYPVQANEVFIRVSSDEAARLRAGGFDFYDWGDGAVRMVTNWHHRAEDVQPLADAIAAL